MPDGAKLTDTSWSHDSKKFAFVLVTDQGQQLWVADVANPTKPTMLTDRLNTVMGGFSWMPDGEHVVCRLVPENRGAEPRGQCDSDWPKHSGVDRQYFANADLPGPLVLSS